MVKDGHYDTKFNPALKLLKRPDKILQLQRDGRTSGPLLVEISPTHNCNATCSFCFYAGTHNNVSIPVDRLKAAIDDLAVMGVPAINWTGGGDPSVYKHIAEVVEHANKLGIRQGIFTNGITSKFMPDPALFDWIRVSIIPEYLSDRISKTVLEYRSSNRNVGIVLNQFGETVDDIRQLAKDARDLGVRYFQVRPALVAPGATQPELQMAELGDLCTEEFRAFNNAYKWKEYLNPESERSYDRCLAGHVTPTIWATGDVRVCNYRDEPKFIVGNINHERLLEIWNRDETSDKFNSIGRGDYDLCQRLCKPHECNKVLGDIIDKEVEDVYFV
jgi:MoaA/NifB/PqqE/SkfB family radical SAM enzyme